MAGQIYSRLEVLVRLGRLPLIRSISAIAASRVPIALQNVFAVILYAASLALVMADYEGTSGVWLKHVPEDLRALASLVILASWGFVFLTAIVVAVHIPGFLRGLRKNQPDA